ncbi:hypothetical protein, partial [Sulfitobacter sp.]|uniref:hypothetical protein n=1 Tax=Sulfitobacter sp. TaxID=1903071 RepID=UPI0035644631
MEDDAILSAEFGKTLERLSDAALDFDVIKLDGANQVLRFGPEIETNGIKLRAIHQCVTSAAAYLLSKEGAAKLEARASQYCDHLDDFIFTPRDNWTLLQLAPHCGSRHVYSRRYTQSVSKDCAKRTYFGYTDQCFCGPRPGQIPPAERASA